MRSSRRSSKVCPEVRIHSEIRLVLAPIVVLLILIVGCDVMVGTDMGDVPGDEIDDGGGGDDGVDVAPLVAFSDTSDPVSEELTVKKLNGASRELFGIAGFDGTEWVRHDNEPLPLSSSGIYDLDLEVSSSGTPYVAYAANAATRVGLLTVNGSSYPSSGNAAYGVDLSFNSTVPILSFQDGLQEFGAIVAYAYDSGWSQLGTDLVSSADATSNDSRNTTSAIVGGDLFVGRVDAASNRGIVLKYGRFLP